MEAVLLPAVGVMVTLTLIVMFFSKKHIKNNETKIYSKLILSNLIFLVIGILTYIFAKSTGDFTIIKICQKIYMSILIILNYLSIKYCFSVFKINIIRNKKIELIFSVFTVIFIMLTCVLPLNVIFYDNVLDGEGLAYNIVLVYVVISFVIILGLTFYTLIKKENIYKITPFLILIILYIIGLFLRSVYRELIFEGFFYSYILLVMYHTIENPDVKLLNEYIKNKELAEKNIEDKANMLFKISQDVKEPAKKIELLSNKIIKSNDLTEIYNNARNINILSRDVYNVINNVLDISNIDIRNVKPVDIAYSTNNLFNQIILFSSEKMKPGVDFKYSVSSLIPKSLYGDAVKLKQAIYSIIINSIKTTESGSVDLDISSIIRYDVCRLMITISDTGKGMPLSEINELLENSNNVSEENLESIENLKVDLKVAKKIIDIIGGMLIVKSEENRGTSFTIILNQRIDGNEEKYKTNEPSLVLSNKKKVLLVDDNYEELEKIGKELKYNNFEVVSTMHGEDCLDKLNSGMKFEYVFINDEMEYKNAVELIAKIDTKKNKVIVMLNEDKESIKEHYLEDYPFNDCIIKNHLKSELLRIKNK